jgi:hypothetical protein
MISTMLLEELNEIRSGNRSESECLDIFSKEQDKVIMSSKSREISKEEVSFFIRNSREHIIRIIILDIRLQG